MKAASPRLKPHGHTRTNRFTYTNGLVHTHVDERGLTNIYTWDGLGRLLSVVFPDDTYISNRYSRLDLIATRDRLANWTWFAYDIPGYLVAVTNALDQITSFTYCTCGALESVTDPMTNTTTFTYDGVGRLTALTYGDGSSVTNEYDEVGRLIQVRNSVGQSHTRWHNTQGLLVAISNAFGRVTQIVYDLEDRATNVFDMNGLETSLTFDPVHRLTRRETASGFETFGYSARGLVTYTNQLEQISRYGYDEAGRLIAATNANTVPTQFFYNPAGDLLRLNRFVDSWAIDKNIFWRYDEYGQLTNKFDSLTNLLFAFTYDANGRLKTRWTPAKGQTHYDYNAVGSLTNINYESSTDIQLVYDANQRQVKMIDASGTTTYSYSAGGFLESEDGPFERDAVTYSNNGWQRSGLALKQPNAPDWEQSYSYDTIGRLKTISSPAGASTYIYDTTRKLLPATFGLGGAYRANSYDSEARLMSTFLKTSAHDVLYSHEYL